VSRDRARAQVLLCGSFNAWQPAQGVHMQRAGDASFAATLALPPGTYTYKFVVDGVWIVRDCRVRVRVS
jgi:hypothetical protein